MAEDFFGSIGKSISKTGKNVANKIGIFLESKKIEKEIMAEKKGIIKDCQDIGKIIYKLREKIDVNEFPGTEVLFKDIEDHEFMIAELHEDLEEVKNRKPGDTFDDEDEPELSNHYDDEVKEDFDSDDEDDDLDENPAYDSILESDADNIDIVDDIDLFDDISSKEE